MSGILSGKNTNSGLFSGLPNPFQATRYHSLVVKRESLPDTFEVTAWTEAASGAYDEVMGMKHRTLPIESVQFHPESILTEYGYEMLNNFLQRYSDFTK